MALPSSGAISFSAIRTEYGQSGAFSMGDCAGLNSGLPSSATATVSAGTFRSSARYGPESTMRVNRVQFGGGLFCGYQSGANGSITNPGHRENTATVTQFFTSSAATYVVFSPTTPAGRWKIIYRGFDMGFGTWNGSQWQWNNAFWPVSETGLTSAGWIELRFAG